MKIIFIFVTGISILVVTRTATLGQTIEKRDVPAAGVAQDQKASENLTQVSSGISPDDTLWAKRSVFSMAIYQKEKKVPNAIRKDLFKVSRKARNRFLWGTILRPVGPLMAVSGLAIGYIGIKGTQATAMVRGRRMPNGPVVVPDVQVEYTKRSLPKVLGGLGLLIGGMCFLEISNELTLHSVERYNSYLREKKAQVFNLKMGLSPSGNVGLWAKF